MVGAPPINEARAVGFHPTAGVFVVGHMGNGTRDVWTVRRSQNGGATWTVVDRFGVEPITSGPGVATATAVTLAPSGNVFVTGYSPNPKRLLVRKGTTAANGAMSWVSSDDFQLVSGQNSSSQAIASDIAGNIFTAGSATINSSQLGYFLTRRLNGPQ